MSAAADHSKPFIPLAGGATDGFSDGTNASATCFCGAVQMKFPIAKATDPFICHCYDCRKLTSSMFASNFVVADQHLTFLRGESDLSTYSIASTTTTGNNMTNHFCRICGTLMFRVGEGFPGTKIMRIGTVDDWSLQETVLKPTVEQFTKDRVGWLSGSEEAGVKQVEGYAFAKL